jgi:hypothetical protein
MIDAALLRPVLGALVLALGVDLAALPEKCVNGCATPLSRRSGRRYFIALPGL